MDLMFTKVNQNQKLNSANDNVTMQDNNIDKIDVEELIKDFKVVNVSNFSSYLKELWKVKICYGLKIF